MRYKCRCCGLDVALIDETYPACRLTREQMEIIYQRMLARLDGGQP